MNKFIDYGTVEFPYSSMTVCFSLLNSARIYVRSQSEQVPHDALMTLTGLINHIGVLTTHDFQIVMADLNQEPTSDISVDTSMVLNVLWNYGSHYLNALHRDYQQGDSVLQEQLLQGTDVSTLQSFINDIARRNQIEYYFSKEALFQRFYDIPNQKQK